MATISSRLKNNGTLLLNGDLDEVTFNSSTPTIKNIWRYTQDFTNSYWYKASSLTIANTTAVTAPDGTNTAQIATVGGSGLYPNMRVYPTGAVVPCVPGTTYTVSVYAKYINQQYMTIVNEDAFTGGTSQRFDILNGTLGSLGANIASGSITSIINGWYRLSITYKPIPAGITYWNPQPVRIGSFDGTNYSGSQAYVWGAQLEASSTPTIYQGIAASTVLINTAKLKTTANSIYTAGVFDEVTNSGSATAMTVSNNGNYYVSGSFDEFTGAPVVDSSLILWYDAGQPASYSGSGTTITDLSSSNNAGTLRPNIGFNTIGSWVYTLNSTQYISVANSAPYRFLNTSPYTFDMWVKVTDYPADASYNRLWNRDTNPGGGRDGFNFWIDGTSDGLSIQFYTERWVAGISVNAGATITYSTVANLWIHWVVSYDGTNVRLYRNGTLSATSGSSTGNITNTSASLYIGGQGGTGNPSMETSGLKIYNRALSADEISQNFNALRRRYGV